MRRMTVIDYTNGERQTSCQKQQSSPWGTVQTKVKYLKGVSCVSTAGHGGMLVARGFAAKNFSEAAIKRGDLWNGYLAYEEDCAILIALYELPQLKQHFVSTDEGMFKSLSRYYADYLIEKGVEPEPEAYQEFSARKQDGILREQKSPDLIVSAIGLTDEVTKVWTADDRIHFVTAESYRKRSGLNLLSKCELTSIPNLHEVILAHN